MVTLGLAVALIVFYFVYIKYKSMRKAREELNTNEIKVHLLENSN